MAGTGPLDLIHLMQEYLDACVAALATTVGGVPDCVYLSEGPPPWDVIPSLVVHCGGPALGDTGPLQPMLAPGHRIQTTGEVNLVTLTATVLRCATQIDDEGNLPTAEEHLAVATQTSSDLWAIWNTVKSMKRSETLFAPRSREFFFDPAVAVNQQGGAAGWQITVRTELDGYSAV